MALAPPFNMADATDGAIGALPNYPALASYVDNLSGFTRLVRERGKPGVTLLPITIFGNRARCADFEAGAMSPVQFGGWIDHVAEPDPVGYSQCSMMQAVMDSAGSRKAQFWSAHPGQGQHMCGAPGTGYPGNPGCQFRFSKPISATQWDWQKLIDVSICAADFLFRAPPQPVDPYGYLRLTNVLYDSPYGKISERDVVEHYDGARRHPFIPPWHRILLDKDLKPKLHYLADRVRARALSDKAKGLDGWGLYDRWWRYPQLRRRADGAQFA